MAWPDDEESDDCESDWEDDEADAKMERMRDINRRLPPGFAVAEVRGNHRKPCSVCYSSSSFHEGNLYIYYAAQPRGTDKICERCVDGWLDEKNPLDTSFSDEGGSEEEESDEGVEEGAGGLGNVQPSSAGHQAQEQDPQGGSSAPSTGLRETKLEMAAKNMEPSGTSQPGDGARLPDKAHGNLKRGNSPSSAEDADTAEPHCNKAPRLTK